MAIVAGSLLLGAGTRATGGKDDPRPNVLLITLDTTRADRLGCYGHRDAVTPALDALAARGTLFEQAFTSCPMTLPAHATLLTGRQPPEHGLRLNGANGLAPDIPTLAELLAARGYETGAFVAAFVLNSKFGLNRGFHTYDDDLEGAPAQEVPEPLSVYRPGNTVTDRALAWLERIAVDESRARPFFCWVHLYDAHYPYLPHPELAGSHLGSVASYDAEVAFMDRQVGRLLAFLERKQLAGRTLVIAVGDHGEGLGDHDEVEHGYLLNQEALRVPLIASMPGRTKSGARVDAIVSLVDLFPTVLDLLGVPDEVHGSGRSLVAALRGDAIPSLSSYAETDLPTHFGWSGLRSLTTVPWKYIRSPRPELYDRKVDPRELHDLAGVHPEQVAALETALVARERTMKAEPAPAVALDAEQRRKLESLGYVSGPPERRMPGPLKDIKDMLPVKHLETKLTRGIATGTLGQPEILAIASELVQKSPETASFQMTLGTALVGAGRVDEAVPHLREAVRLHPDFAEAHTNLGNALAQRGNLDEAMDHHREALRIKPDLPEAHLNIGNILTAKGDLAGGIEHYTEAIRLKPDYAEAHCNLASTLAQRGKIDQAVEHFQAALRIRPRFALAHHNLARLLAQRGKLEEAITHEREAVQIAPDFAAAHYALGKALSEEGELGDAIAHYEAATRLQPKEAEFCDNLAAAYVAAGRIEQAVATATRAVELAHNAGQDDLASDAARRLALYRRMLARKAEAAADGMQAGRTPAARRQRKSADDGSLPQRSR